MDQAVEKKVPLPLWRRILLALIVIIIAGLMSIIVANYFAGVMLGLKINAIAESGEPLDFYTLARIDKNATVTGEDASDYYTNAAMALPNNILPGVTKLNLVYRATVRGIPEGQPFPEDLVNTVNQNLAGAKPLFESIDKAASLPLYRYDINVQNGFQQARGIFIQNQTAAYIVSLRTLDHIRNKRYPAAAKSIVSQLKMVRQYTLTPVLHLQDSKNAIILLACSDIQLLLEKSKLPKNILAVLSKEIALLTSNGDVARTMMAERIYQLSLIKNYLPEDITAKYFTTEPEMPETVMLSPRHLGRLYRRAKTYIFLNDMDKLILDVRKPWPDLLNKYPIEQLEEGQRPDFDQVCARMIHSNAQIGVLLKSISLAFSCEQYYNENKQYPDSLDQISASFGVVIPKDPFSGNDLLFKRDDNGYLIYSVGANGKDDGGALLPTADNKIPLDTGFVVRYGQGK